MDIYWFQRVFTPDVPGLQVYVETTQGQNSSAGLCVSDNTTRPILVEAGPAETEFDHQFTLGNPPYKWMEITRKNGRNRMVFSHGVWISDRNCNNTFDTFGTESFSDPPTLGRAFRSWARQAPQPLLISFYLFFLNLFFSFLQGLQPGPRAHKYMARGFESGTGCARPRDIRSETR